MPVRGGTMDLGAKIKSATKRGVDPARHGLTWEEWFALSDHKRHHLQRMLSDYHKVRRQREPEKLRAIERRCYWKNREKRLETYRAKWARIASLNSVKADPDKVYWAAQKAVSTNLPRHVRDDVIGSILLAVMEGKLLVGDIKKRMGEFLRAHNREYDQFKTKSLDAIVPGTDNLRLVDTIASDHDHF